MSESSLPEILSNLRAVPKLFAELAFDYSLNVEKEYHGVIRVVEASRSQSISKRLFCFGRTYAEVENLSNKEISLEYYNDSMKKRYLEDYTRILDTSNILVDDYKHDPFVEHRAFTYYVDIFPEHSAVDRDVVADIFRSVGFTVTPSVVSYGGYDAVMNYGDGINAIIINSGMSVEVRKLVARLLSRTTSTTPKEYIANTEMLTKSDELLIGAIREYKETHCTQDRSKNDDSPSIGIKTLRKLVGDYKSVKYHG